MNQCKDPALANENRHRVNFDLARRVGRGGKPCPNPELLAKRRRSTNPTMPNQADKDYYSSHK
jgi:hypothetical protein